MRDFRDSKAMAQSLRQALTTKAIAISHSESLELISKAFGLENWNILSARIEAEAPAKADPVLHCSFCGKSQHEVPKLIAGPKVFICEPCVSLCTQVVEHENLVALLRADQAASPDSGATPGLSAFLAACSADQVRACRAGVDATVRRLRSSLHMVGVHLGEHQPDPATAETSIGTLEGRSRDELEALRARLNRELSESLQVLEAIDAASRDKA